MRGSVLLRRYTSEKAIRSETAPKCGVTILSVSPMEEDHVSLEAIFSRSEWAAYTSCQWKLHSSYDALFGSRVLGQKRIPIVICEGNLLPGTWKDMLERLGRLPQLRFLSLLPGWQIAICGQRL